MPERIQRRMSAGWRAPLDTEGRPPVYVGRPGPFGNPHRVVFRKDTGGWHVRHVESAFDAGVGAFASKSEAARLAVAQFRHGLERNPELQARTRAELADRNLMCWCKTTDPCHADVLLDFANQEVPGDR